jgi:hypothetical protein
VALNLGGLRRGSCTRLTARVGTLQNEPGICLNIQNATQTPISVNLPVLGFRVFYALC